MTVPEPGRSGEPTPVEPDADADAVASGEEAAPGRRAVRPRDPARRRGLGRAVGLTTLSALLPGLGLLRTRARALGAVVVGLAVLGLVALGAYVLTHGALDTALTTAASTGRLHVLVAVLVAGSALWAAVVALTAVLTRPAGGWRQGVLALVTVALCAAVAAPAVVGTRYVDAHLSAVDKIFKGEPAGSTGGAFSQGIPRGSDDPWANIPRVNVLMLGSDAGDDRVGVRTDTMIIASINTRTGDSVLLSIPRNLERVPIPRSNPLSNVYPHGFDCGDACLMNAIWTAAEENAKQHPAWYKDDPTPGLTATREVLAAVIGQPIQQTVIVNLRGFQELIDAMGGVTIKVQERLPLGGQTWKDAEGRSHLIPGTENGWLEPGVRKLNGYQALSYSRSRVTTDDFSRMRRQRCMVAAVVDQVDPMTMLRRYPQVIAAVGDNVTTDIGRAELPAWATLVERAQQGRIRSLPFTANNTNVVDPNFSDIRYRVYEALFAPPKPKASSKGTASTDDAASTSTSPTRGSRGDSSSSTTSPAVPTSDTLEDVGAVCG